MSCAMFRVRSRVVFRVIFRTLPHALSRLLALVLAHVLFAMILSQLTTVTGLRQAVETVVPRIRPIIHRVDW